MYVAPSKSAAATTAKSTTYVAPSKSAAAATATAATTAMSLFPVTLGDAEGEPLGATEGHLPTCTKLLFLVATELLWLIRIRICPSAILRAASLLAPALFDFRRAS